MMGRIFYIILNILRSSKILTYILWGIKIESKLHDVFWDLTTLVLKKEIVEIKNKKFFLDMGCGQFAIIGQFFKSRNILSEVTSVDFYSKFVINSIKNSKLNLNNITILKSDLFSNLGNKKFDLITFNPPYVPSGIDTIEKNFKNIRYSGNDGTLVIKKFLKQVKKHLFTGGIILLGINTYYVPENMLKKILISNGFMIQKISRMRFNTSIVFKLTAI